MLALRICLLVPLLASISRADFRLLDDEHPLLADAPATAPAKAAFDKDTWSFDLAGSYITHIRYSEDYFTTGSARFNYYVIKNLAFTFGVSGYLVDQPDNDAIQSSLDIGGRLHLLRIDRFTLYFDGGGIRTWSDTAVPEGGTTYNYIGRVGGGLTYHLFDNVHLMAGARYFHQSNGDIHHRINNPGYDGIESYAGLIFTF